MSETFDLPSAIGVSAKEYDESWDALHTLAKSDMLISDLVRKIVQGHDPSSFVIGMHFGVYLRDCDLQDDPMIRFVMRFREFDVDHRIAELTQPEQDVVMHIVYLRMQGSDYGDVPGQTKRVRAVIESIFSAYVEDNNE